MITTLTINWPHSNLEFTLIYIIIMGKRFKVHTSDVEITRLNDIVLF